MSASQFGTSERKSGAECNASAVPTVKPAPANAPTAADAATAQAINPTIEMFTKRNATLAREIKQLQASEAELMRKQEIGSQASQAAMDIIPTAQHILDNYDVLTIAEKNRLWKLVMKKATVYRTPEGELSVHIYPKLPK